MGSEDKLTGEPIRGSRSQSAHTVYMYGSTTGVLRHTTRELDQGFFQAIISQWDLE